MSESENLQIAVLHLAQGDFVMHELRPACRAMFALVLLSLLSARPEPLNAHHGWAGYLDAEFELTGTLETAVSLANPHASMKIRVDDQVWDAVLAPPQRTAGAGLREGIIPIGDRVTVQGHRHRDPKRFEIKTERVIWRDRMFNVYPDRR
jgi:Family of unknown function (DUF6152)